MQPKLIELRPDRKLLNPNFDGYKLSLEPIKYLQENLVTPVDRQVPSINQYSLLHARLYGLHNHLVGETKNHRQNVFFVDKNWKIFKYFFDPSTQKLRGNIVWEIPIKDREQGAYNVSIKLLDNIVLVADGMGCLYILNRDPDDLHWNLLFEDEVIGISKNFVITDAVLKEDRLHLLLLRIETENNENVSKLNWITLSKINEKWGEIALRELEIKSPIQYAHFEKTCEAIYIVSESGCKFTIDSEPQTKTVKYKWTQNKENITIKFPLVGVTKEDILVNSQVENLEVKVKTETVLEGTLFQTINPELTNWTFENDVLEVSLNKNECGLMWPEVVEGNPYGEFELDPSVASEIGEKLQHLTSESEVAPAAGTTFNSQQVEECDFEFDKLSYFERISSNHDVTHKLNLGSHQILCTVDLISHEPPAIGIRSDVDTFIWQPTTDENSSFQMIHKGTLYAMGYIQASKQQKKFFVAAPDLSYSAICESTKHLFIYRQNKAITSGELRNRTTGQKVGTIAEQRVFNVTPNEDILGIYATNTCLFLLGETFLMLLQF